MLSQKVHLIIHKIGGLIEATISLTMLCLVSTIVLSRVCIAQDGNGQGSGGGNGSTPSITITPPALPAGEVGVPYSPGQTFTATDSGKHGGGFTFSATGLPQNGISLDPNGTVHGTPAAALPVSFSVTATGGRTGSFKIAANTTHALFAVPQIAFQT